MNINGTEYEGENAEVRNGLVYIDGKAVAPVDPDNSVVIISDHPVTVLNCDQNLVIGNDCNAKELIARGNISLWNLNAVNADITSYAAIHVENLNATNITAKGTVNVENLQCKTLNAKQINIEDE